MLVKQVEVNDIIPTNAYFYIDENSGHGFLIDPAAQADVLLEIIRRNKWTIEKLLITHGHFDHIGAVEQIAKALNVAYYIHEQGKEYLLNPEMNVSCFCMRQLVLPKAEYFADGAQFAVSTASDMVLQAIYTPGHTSDSVVYYDAEHKVAFCGDTIFLNSVGRTDFPGGNSQHLWQSIKQKIFTLPDNTVLYSGHSEPTTVGMEKTRY